MGYRSDVGIAVAFDNERSLQEVQALYAMDSTVQAEGLGDFVGSGQSTNMLQWECHVYRNTVDSDVFILTINLSGVKYYPSYPTTKAIEYMHDLCQMLARENPDFVYAYKSIEVGEEVEDTTIIMDTAISNKFMDESDELDEIRERCYFLDGHVNATVELTRTISIDI